MKPWLKYFFLIGTILLPAQINHVYGSNIIINEIMANPVGLTLLPETEYIEIYNTSDTAISLNNWSFIYDGKAVKLPDIMLPANEYAVLFRSGRDITIGNTGIALPINDFPANLANAGKTIGLRDPQDVDMDVVTYSTAKAACSWERGNESEWYLSTDPKGGTPGTINSPKEKPKPPIVNPSDHSQPGDVIINEIMANPTGLALLPETEYIEIFNNSGSDIPLHNWSFIYDGKEITFPDTMLPIGGYAVLYRTGRDIFIENTAMNLSINNFPANLANTGKTIGLKNSHGIDIDIVTYATAKAACAWERSAENEWYLSTDPKGGTPGTVNSPKETPKPPIVNPSDHSKPGDVIINEIMASPTGLTLLPETEYIEIYNNSGSAIPLYNWSFVYDGKKIILPDTILPIGGFAVLYRTGRDILIENTAINLPVNNFPANLANTGKTVGLKNSHGIDIDIVTYAAAKAACAWERSAENEWYLSTDPKGGTPGTINSQKETPKPPTINPSDHSKPGDIIINEIMANPVGLTLLPETEYVEIYNVSGSNLSLYGWSFLYDGKEIMLPDTTLPVNSYAVLYREGRDILIENTGINLPISNFPANLVNTGKTVGLKNSHGIDIDVVTYITAKAACAWERSTENEWYLSTDPKGGTPGKVNSPKEASIVNPSDHSKPGNVIINEVMANPTGLTQLAETEYIEIYNTSGTTIPLHGWSLIYDAKAITLPDTLLPADGYAVLYRTGREIILENTGLALPLNNFPANLANAGKTIGLKNSHGIDIDVVTYTTAKAACSWERDAENEWYLSTDPKGGTPGGINSLKDRPIVNPADHSMPGDMIINEVMADPAGLTQLPETEYVELYNMAGSAMYLKGWLFIYDNKAIEFPDTIIPANTYIVLFRAGREIHIDKDGIALPIENFPANLANTGKSLQIKNSNHISIDSISYAVAKSGSSWERDTDNEWYLSYDPRGGTPGSVNSSKENIKPPGKPENPDTTDNSIFGDIIINEIMANPVGLTKLPETEYIELYNTLDSTIYLKGWSLVYDGKSSAIPDTQLLAKQYAVLFRDGRDIFVENTGIKIPASGFPANLANTGKMLQIRNSFDSVIDSINYKAAKPARSWERDNEGYWYLSNDSKGGTPGATNSSKEGGIVNPENPKDTTTAPTFIVLESELIFNEILPEPSIGGSEYIELYNRSERTLSIRNLSIATRKTDGELSTRYSLTSISDSIHPDQYFILTNNRNGVLDFYYTPDTKVVYELKLPALNNTGATLVLLRTHDGFVIDQLIYSSKWHDAAIKNSKGVSLERINPDIETQSATNWTSANATVGYGTPGYKNSQWNDHINGQQTVFINAPEYDPAFNEYTITYQTDKPGYRCRIEVYTIEGHKDAVISNNQFLGTTGEIRWSGTGSDGSRLHTGIYIFYAELYHPDGAKSTYKKVFLIK